MITLTGFDALNHRLTGANGGRQLMLSPAFLDAAVGQSPTQGRGTNFAFGSGILLRPISSILGLVGRIWHLKWTRWIL
jgi:hypothetical protein